MTTERTNWAGTITYGAARIHRPTSIDQLQHLVAEATKIRALGSRHSFNDVANTDGDLVSLASLPVQFSLDHERSTVTVAAGARHGDVCHSLHDNGYALHNLGSLPHISMAGAVATATHGSGDGNRNLAASVTSMELVTGDGELVTVSRADDPDRFPGTVVALGALGIVVSMTVEVVPTFDVRQQVYEGLARTTFAANFEEIVSSAYSVSVFTDFANSDLIVWRKRRVTEPEDPAPGAAWMGARQATGLRHPVPGLPVENCTGQLGVPGPWYDRLPHFRLDFTPSSGSEVQSEYLVPREHAVDALRALDGLAQHIAPVLQVCEIRTVAADDLWLSPAYERDVVGFHFTWVKDPDAVLAVLGLIEKRLAPFEARPHWGKLFAIGPDVLPSLFPRLPDFRALRREFDPAGVFSNAFVNRHIG